MKTGAKHLPGFREAQVAFTLVEVLIAVSLVLTLFVSLYVGMSYGYAVTDSERQNLRATQIMVERMEGIRLFTWDELLDQAKNPPAFTNFFYPAATGLQSRGVVYTGTLTVVTNPVLTPTATYSTNMMMITVRVQWNSGNLTHTRSMSTYVSRNGMQNYIYGN
jgi:type II secretory pathway pseudopilin PulG